jgi:hypothetical protein
VIHAFERPGTPTMSPVVTVPIDSEARIQATSGAAALLNHAVRSFPGAGNALQDAGSPAHPILSNTAELTVCDKDP